MLQISKKIKSLIKLGQRLRRNENNAWIYVSQISLDAKFFDQNKQQAYYLQEI